MSSRKWLLFYFLIQIGLLVFICTAVYYVDPFFHYHEPDKRFYYELDNQRSQNDGITRHFAYNAMITGTSMTDNFKTSEAHELFNKDFIKVPYEGATYKEIHDDIKVGIESNDKLEMVIWGLDMVSFFADPQAVQTMEERPTYLYDNNPFNDVYYVFNRDIFFGRIGSILSDFFAGREGGMTSFDDYSNWMKEFETQFGSQYALSYDPDGFPAPSEELHLTKKEIEIINENIQKNIIDLVNLAPDVQFYLFIPPYSVAFWGEWYRDGELEKRIEAEQIVVEQLLKCNNVKLYSFNTFEEITTNLNNYKDRGHYGEWINSDILYYMKNNIGLITTDNYLQYLGEEKDLYGNYDYTCLYK